MAAGAAVDQLASDYAAQPVVFLEQNVDAPLGGRTALWWAANTNTGTIYLPLVMADSGHYWGNGYVSFYSVYQAAVDAEIARPAGADLVASARRTRNHFRVSVQVTNRSGSTLSSSNQARIQAFVYEDIKIGVTSRTIRSVASVSIGTALEDNASRSLVLDTDDISPADWSKVHVVVAVDYRPGGTTGAYDMLQAVFADIAPPAAGDFGADQKSDILWRHSTYGDVWLWPMDGSARTAETHVRTVGDTNWEIRGLGDLTGDGKADIVWRHKTLGMVYFWPMDGSTPLAETYVATVDPAYDIAGTGDFNGDGKTDLLWRHTTLGEVWVWLMNGATPLGQVYVDRVDPAYEIKGVGDLDGDGKADIVWHHGTLGEVWVWLMDGTTRLSATLVGTVPDVGYEIVGVADFTGDGNADLLWHHATRGEVWLWPMAGAARTAETRVGTVPDTDYRIVNTGDYDGDGKADILWHHAMLGEVWVWLMDGATRLSETWIGTVADPGYRIIR